MIEKIGIDLCEVVEWNEEEILQELVNKTMPMTPKKELMTGSGTTAIYAIVCGDCEGEVEKHFSYCPYCSQEIDWKNHDE
jgi:hypothetical protein